MLKFSIITVVKNDLNGLKKTQNSIASQTKSSYEWIVIDGNSTDSTKGYVLNRLKDNKCISENDNGIYDAMNKGIGMSTGEYVVFLNAGDTFSNTQVLSDIGDIIHHSEHYDIIFCGANLKFNSKSHYRGVRKIEQYIWHGLPANHQATFFKLSAIVNNRYSDEYKLSGDYYIVSKLYMSKALCAYHDKPIVNFSMGGFSYQNPLLALKEAYLIQKNVLKTSLFLRLLSASRRILAHVIVKYLYI